MDRLELKDIAVTRGSVPVLQGVSFDVSPGEAVILRGPNGIGKTTLLRTIAGLQPPLAGELHGAGERVAYASHADGLKPTLSVTENLTFWAEVFGTRDIAPALSAFHLEPLADRAAGALSAGQKRRLGLARMLVTGRPLWLFDEPTVSLDVEAVGWFASAVSAHLAAGGSALIATHIDLGLAGRVVQLGPFKATAEHFDQFDEAFL